jgi:glycosyltransferase involved in cell wall biosynthesis
MSQLPQIDPGALISIVMPAYNEDLFLGDSVAEVVRQLEEERINFELIIVENGSTDETPGIADALANSDSRIRVIHLSKADYGHSLRTGLLEGSGHLLANFSVDLVDIPFLKKAIQESRTNDLMFASKLVSGSSDEWSFFRKIGGSAYHGLARLILHIPIADTHGVKLMRRDRVRPIIEKCTSGGEIFDDELAARANRAGLVMLELPMQWQDIRPSRTGVMKRALRALRQLIGLRVRLWRESLGARRGSS